MKTRTHNELQEVRRGPAFSGRHCPKSTRTTASPFACLLLLMAVAAVATAKGKPGGGGGTDPGIPAVGLGLPAGCSSAADVFAKGIGDDGSSAYLVAVAAGIQGCEPGSPPQPYLWSNGSWQAIDVLPPHTGGQADDVSEEGGVVGSFGGGPGTAFAQRSGSNVEALPKGGFYHSDAWDISNNGRFVAGNLDVVEGDFGHAASWAWTGSAWSLEILGRGGATSISEDGSLLAGWAETEDDELRAALWRRGNPQPIDLGSSSDFRLQAIAPAGDLVVGLRWASCAKKRDPDCRYPVPVYWTRQQGTGEWVPTDLEALDGVDSEARGVANVVGKGLVIVGFGFTRADKVLRAVAWIPQPDGSYGAPIRLAPLGGDPATPAAAWAVNSYGVVQGTSWIAGKGRSSYARASLWVLP